MYFRGTTPTFLLFIEGVQLQDTDELEVNFTTGRDSLIKKGTDLTIDYDKNTIGVSLTQTETFALSKRDKVTRVQVRGKKEDGQVWMTPIARVSLFYTLFEEEI